MSKLYAPVAIVPIALSHRVVRAPLTRLRSEQPGDLLGDLMDIEFDRGFRFCR
jgi:N-ethylmaleimide reductase